MSEMVLQVRTLRKGYGTAPNRVEVLNGLDLELAQGAFEAVMGPSGSGKSTLLHLLAGLLVADSGTVALGGAKVTEMGDAEVTVFRRRRVGLVFQDFNLIPTLNAEENIVLPLLLDRRRPDRAALETLLARLNLSARRHHLPAQLSGGERQRVAIARALVTRPAIVLADEPTGNPDGAITSRAQLVSDLMRSARERGLATGGGGLSDPGSAKRAALIVDTNAALAAGYASYATGATHGARLAYPAQELIRIEERREKRPWPIRWAEQGGRLYGPGKRRMIALKDDPICSAISRFGVPYGPPDYNSGMGWQDISFEEAVELGVIPADYTPSDAPLADFNATLQADLTFQGPDDPHWIFLKDTFGDQIRYQNGKVHWQADLILDAFSRRAADSTYQATLRLGQPTAHALAKAPPGSLPGHNLTMQADHLYHESRRHIGAAETHPNNVPLTTTDLTMIPHTWRSPDRVTPDADNTLFCDLQSADGSWYRLILQSYPKETRFKTFYKLKAGASGLPITG